jgi:hypothetical protein
MTAEPSFPTMKRTIRNPFTQAVAVCALAGTLALAHPFAAAQDKPLLNTWGDSSAWRTKAGSKSYESD